MTKDEALNLALEALERLALPKNADDIFRRAITAIKEALAQPEQEPVACVEYIPCCTNQTCSKCKAATPPQRTWVGLTEKDICEAAVKSQDGISPRNDTLRFAIAIEAKLKEKNT